MDWVGRAFIAKIALSTRGILFSVFDHLLEHLQNRNMKTSSYSTVKRIPKAIDLILYFEIYLNNSIFIPQAEE